MKPVVDQEKCIGCGTCAAICPQCFAMTDHKAIVLDTCDFDAQADKINEAKEACPVAAISIEE